MFSIILDIVTKVIREHIKHYLNENRFEDVNQLIDSIRCKQKMFNGLNKGCYWKIPASLDSFDITKSFALIHNVINELHKESKFNYDSKKYDYCLQLKEIRNEKYAHIEAFKMDDVEFSVAVVTIQEIIRQLCDFDSSLCQGYLDKVEEELEKDSNQLLSESEVIKLLKEQKEEFQMSISKLETSLSASNNSAIRSIGDELKVSILPRVTGVGQSQKDFIQLIERMKDNEASRILMFKKRISEQTERMNQIDLKTSQIESNISIILKLLKT
jgi:hypothetical protein